MPSEWDQEAARDSAEARAEAKAEAQQEDRFERGLAEAERFRNYSDGWGEPS